MATVVAGTIYAIALEPRTARVLLVVPPMTLLAILFVTLGVGSSMVMLGNKLEN